MNTALIEQIQARLAQGISDHPVLGSHAKAGKINALINRFQQVAAGVSLVALMGVGAMTPGTAQAQTQSFVAFPQQSSPSFPISQSNQSNQSNQGSSVNDQRQRQADVDLQNRVAQQAAREAEQRRDVDNRTGRILGDVAGNLGGAIVRNSGGNYYQANSVGGLSKIAVGVFRGTEGTDAEKRIFIGASAGSVLASMIRGNDPRSAGNDSRSAGIKTAIGGALGALGGYAWDQASKNQPPAKSSSFIQSPPSPSQPNSSSEPVFERPQAGQSPSQRAQSGGIEDMLASSSKSGLRFTRVGRSPEVRPLGNSVYSAPVTTIAVAPPGPAVPAVMLEVMQASGLSITPPGIINVQMTAAAVQSEPVIDAALTQMAAATDSLAKRMALIELAASMRDSANFNQIEVGAMSTKIVKADQEVRTNIARMIMALNSASSVGFNTTPMLKAASQVVKDCYISDDAVKLSNQLTKKAKYYTAPR